MINHSGENQEVRTISRKLYSEVESCEVKVATKNERWKYMEHPEINKEIAMLLKELVKHGSGLNVLKFHITTSLLCFRDGPSNSHFPWFDKGFCGKQGSWWDGISYGHQVLFSHDDLCSTSSTVRAHQVVQDYPGSPSHTLRNKNHVMGHNFQLLNIRILRDYTLASI